MIVVRRSVSMFERQSSMRPQLPIEQIPRPLWDDFFLWLVTNGQFLTLSSHRVPNGV